VRHAEAVGAGVLEPGEVVEVAAVRDRQHRPSRVEAAGLVRDRVRSGDDRVRLPGDESGDAPRGPLLHAHDRPLRVPVRMRPERVAEVRHPLRARRRFHRRPDEVDRARRRRRQDDVDALGPGDGDRLGDRGRGPRHVLVGDEQPPADGRRAADGEVDARPAVQLVGEAPAARPDVARAVDPRLRRQRQVSVLVQPFRVVGREDVGLDPQRRQVARELQRALYSAAPRRREVQRHQ